MDCGHVPNRPASPKGPAFWLLVLLSRLDKLSFMSETGLMTLAEAATYLGVSMVSLRRWTTNGQLRCVRVGSRRDRRFRKSDLDAYIRRNMTDTQASRKKSAAKKKKKA